MACCAAARQNMTADELRSSQWNRLRTGLARALPTNLFLQRQLGAAGITLDDLQTPDDLARIPFVTKDDLVRDQAAIPPFGSNLSGPAERYCRVHQTSGTTGRRLFWLDDADSWHWICRCWGTILDWAGVTRRDRVFFPFSFGPFLGFWAGFDAARDRGCLVIAGGGLGSLARLELLREVGGTVIACTPTCALRLIEVAREHGFPLAALPVRVIILAGEPGGSILAIRQRIEADFAARVLDHYGMTEIGPLVGEHRDFPGRPFLLEEDCIAEVIDSTTGKPVGEGAVGELVLTNLGRWGSPLVRYRTGDLVRCLLGPHPEGMPFRSLEGGILGRVDDMLSVKGNNVYPAAIESLVREFNEVAEFQIELIGEQIAGEMVLRIEPDSTADESLGQRVREAFQNRFFFRPEIAIVPLGTLPRAEMKSRRWLHRPRPTK